MSVAAKAIGEVMLPRKTFWEDTAKTKQKKPITVLSSEEKD